MSVVPGQLVPRLSSPASRLDGPNGPQPHVAVDAPWLVRLEPDPLRRHVRDLPAGTRIAKRAVDLVGASILLLLTIPLMAVVALLVRLTSPGPAIYRQTRVGLNQRQRLDRRKGGAGEACAGGERRGRDDRRRSAGHGGAFTLYKFRTMAADAERLGARFAERGDSRVTPLGRLLRRTRIDELPQLWNVLRGDMSLVGPRPERPEFVAQFGEQIPGYLDRLGLKPGLTGLAQVENGYDNDLDGFRRKAAYDRLYLQNCCLRNDLKILLRTVKVVLTGQGAL